MSLFQQSVLKKYISDIDQAQLQHAWQLFQQHFFNADIQQNIRNSKEEEYQEGFVRDLFVNVLGYTLNPQPKYNFVLEKKTITDATKSDGAILMNDDVIGVVELKDTGTPDLDKVSNQAFGYKHKHKNCIYVVTSNFEKLRFYINDATDFEEFELFTLTQERFALLYLCLQQQNLLANVPLQIKQQSLVKEENVTKELYADYSLFKRKLFQNIAEQNPQYDKLLLFKKTQKLLDRFLFIFFAEDKSLLPPNSVREILKQWEQLKELDNYVALYDRFKKYFGYLNVGHVGKQHEIFAYNGGLFLPDEVLDNIIIDDTILYEGTKTLSGYDFETDVDVNILGHIFEHSLTEIEELQLELEGKAIEKSKTKRKKEGVFYTPRYITKYIVENTVGALCTQKKEELDITEETFAPQKRKANRKALLTTIEAYRQWLLQLTICDPACGSGAFLNAALEYLKAEHRTLDELTARMMNEAIAFTDLDNTILEHNLFGVDINEDAIEIAKLSLWLHTAKKGRKLSNLSNNIKCGNSLIDDKTVAGDKAFNWKEEFKNVFDNGGFDVVIGNPPYVPAEYISSEQKQFLEKKYYSAFGRINLYPLFYELAITLLDNNGMIGLITPYTIFKNQYYINARRLILEKTEIISLIDFSGYTVFADAAVDSIILILKNNKLANSNIQVITLVEDFPIEKYKTFTADQLSFLRNDDLSFDVNTNTLDLKKISDNTIKLSQIIDFSQGVITGDNKSFIKYENEIGTKPLITGSDFNRYNLQFHSMYLLYNENLHRPRKKEIFEATEKILLRQTGSYPICTYDNEQYYTLDTVHNGKIINNDFHIKYLLCLLNSKFFKYLYNISINETNKIFAQVKIIYVDPLPVKSIKKDQQQPFIDKANIMLEKNKALNQLSEQFTKLLQTKFPNINVNNKLQNWYSLTANEFFKELTKQKIKLPLSEQQEWLQYFERQKTNANNIQQTIQQTDNEIDAMVYALYGLTDVEIKIAEGK